MPSSPYRAADSQHHRLKWDSIALPATTTFTPTHHCRQHRVSCSGDKPAATDCTGAKPGRTCSRRLAIAYRHNGQLSLSPPPVAPVPAASMGRISSITSAPFQRAPLHTEASMPCTCPCPPAGHPTARHTAAGARHSSDEHHPHHQSTHYPQSHPWLNPAALAAASSTPPVSLFRVGQCRSTEAEEEEKVDVDPSWLAASASRPPPEPASAQRQTTQTTRRRAACECHHHGAVTINRAIATTSLSATDSIGRDQLPEPTSCRRAPPQSATTSPSSFTWASPLLAVLLPVLTSLQNAKMHRSRADQRRGCRPQRRSQPSGAPPGGLLLFATIVGLIAISSLPQSFASPCITSDCTPTASHSMRSLPKRSSDYSPLNLHRHHHPSHPHYHSRAQSSPPAPLPSAQPYSLYASAAAQSYPHHSGRYLQSEQPFGLQPNRPQPATATTERPVSSDRTVRRISSAAESNHYHHPYHSELNLRIPYRTSYHQMSHISQPESLHRPTPPPAVSRSSHSEPLRSCPEGPPSQWDGQLDVASKAYLAPVVFTGQLISLSEDYGGRIGATFRFLRLVKPDKQQHSAGNSTAMSALMAALAPTADYERHIKLYFVRNRTSTGTEPPFCAHHMVHIKERLLTKQNYIIFAHETILSASRFNLPTGSHHHGHHVAKSGSHHSFTRHTPIELISLVTYADPEPQNRNTSRLVRKVLCNRCAKAAVVHSSTSTLTVPVRGNITLACRIDGTPLPWIEWYRNGKRLRTRAGKRVTIKRKRRVSHLTIVRASHRRDRGVYECRAMNVVSKEPAVKRIQVIVTKTKDKSAGSRRKVASTSTTLSGSPVHYPESTSTSKRPVDPPEYFDSHEAPNAFQRKPSGLFHGQPCPIPDYCLNGGTCSLYETLGEYVCQCADGYRGQRCEFKDIFKYPAHKALLDYDLSTRMLHSVMSQKVSEDDV